MPDSAWLDRSAYPFAAHHLDLPAGRMHYVDEGSGPAVLMVHGNPTWSFLYRHLIVHLRADYRCVAPDHLGFGLSEKPPGWSYHPRDQAANLAALVGALDLEEITLVVQDWGGPIGMSYAVAHPERVRRIVIMNTWMWPVNRDPWYVAFSAITGGPLGRFLTRRYNVFARYVVPAVYGDTSRLTAEIHRHYLAPLGTPAEREGCAVLPGKIVGATDWLDDLWSRRAALAPIPKLVVWGMKDLAFRPKELARWEEAFPDAEVVRLPDVGHYVQEEAPARLNEAVGRFLASMPFDRTEG